MKIRLLQIFALVCSCRFFEASENYGSLISNNPSTKAAVQIIAILNDQEQYSNQVIPSVRTTESVVVQTAMTIQSIVLDDIKNSVILDTTLHLQWNDYRLLYNESVPFISFKDTSKFWVPDIFFSNSYETATFKSVGKEADIKVGTDGVITYSRRFKIIFSCPMDLRNFPYDIQECNLIMENFGYTEDKVFLRWSGNSINLYSSKDFLPSKFKLQTVLFNYCDSKLPVIIFHDFVSLRKEKSCLKLSFKFSRKLHTYIIDFYLPCMNLVIISFLSGLLKTSDLLPRIALTLGPLLTLMAASQRYSETLPMRPYTTAYDIFCGVSLLAIGIMLVYVLLSYYLQKEQKEEKETESEIPTWKKILEKMKKRRNLITVTFIFGMYAVFVIIYFCVYGINIDNSNG